MIVDDTVIKKVARLARIRLTSDQNKHFANEISNMLSWMEMLQEINTDAIDPMFSVNQSDMKRRQDVVTDGNYVDAVLANAPNASFGMFIVPKVIE